MENKLQQFLQLKFGQMAPEQLAGLLNKWNIIKTLKKDDVILHKHPEDEALYFIEKGSVKVCTEKDETEFIFTFGYANTCIFNMPAFMSGKSSGIYIQAIKQTTLWGIRRHDFLQELQKNESLNTFWNRNTENILLELVERETDLLTNAPTERYNRLLQRHPALFQHIPKKHIAAYLNMSPETLSRLSKS